MAAPPLYTPTSILVTGGAGFIGSAVVRRLAARYPEYRIIALDRLDPCASLRSLDAVAASPNVTFVKGDILSGDLLAYVLTTERVDTVLHFAAQTHVDLSFGNSLAFTLTNTYGTHCLLEACRVVGGVRRVVNVSTDEVYGDASAGRALGMGEESTLEPTKPYSAAKVGRRGGGAGRGGRKQGEKKLTPLPASPPQAGAEMVARAYYTSYKLPVITTRGNNVYGPGQFPEKLVPKFALLAARGRPLPVHGDGEATRSYLYVDDVAEAFDVVLHKGVVGETYNIGSQKERSVLSVAADVSAMYGDPAPRLAHVRDRAFNDQRYYVCDSKLAALGWAETTPWEEGLRRTVDWYARHTPPPGRGDGGGGEDAWWDAGDVEAALAAHPAHRESLARPMVGGRAEARAGG